MRNKSVKLPLGLAEYFLKEKLEPEFITYLKLRSKKRFHNTSYSHLAKYLKVHKSTAKRHIKTLMQHGLVSFNQTTLTPIGCQKAKNLFAETVQEKKVISINQMEKSVCLKYILIRSNIRQQEYNQNKITKITSKLADPNVSQRVKKMIYKKSKTVSQKLSSEFSKKRSSTVEFKNEYSYVGLSNEKIATIISKSKITARRFIKKVSSKGLIKVEQKFIKSKKKFLRVEFEYLKRFEQIPYYSKLINETIYVQMMNRLSIMEGVSACN